MRAAPPCQFSLQRFGLWQLGVFSVSAAGVASTLTWLVVRDSAFTAHAAVALAIGTLLSIACTVSLMKAPATSLRWDGRTWHLTDAVSDSVSGDLIVTIDLGAWMLLRFKPDAATPRARDTWLPVQRRGLEAQWHALRCSVYSPQPAAADELPESF
jgi:hypothetical protein